ncbi:hypothetical protein [Maritalea sp.]|uniref:hypothetical protein n=1 Tax=Maritalea sp. TaxID=2003361 RepID=UPI003EF53CC7
MLIPFRRYRLSELEKDQGIAGYTTAIVGNRKRVRVAVIDDQPFFQLENLNTHGFDIAFVGNPKSLSHLEAFEVVACDLRGVGDTLNGKLQGAAIIQELRRTFPTKYLIAYSGSFARSAMVNLALDVSDTSISKSADLDSWMKILDDAVVCVLDPIAKWHRLRDGLIKGGANQDALELAEDAYVRSILLKDPKKIRKLADSNSISADAKSLLLGVVSSAIWGALAAL